MIGLINRLRRELGLTVLLIEHDMKVVMEHQRPGHGPRPRREDRRGHAGRGPARTPRSSRPTSGRRRHDRAARRRPPHPGAPSAQPGSMLALEDVHTYYGHIHALQGVTMRSARGEIVTLIGANGAGKTTTLKTISGLLHPRQGSVTFEGKDISKTPAHELVRAGHRPRARRPPDLLPADRPREPPDGRLHPRPQDGSGPDIERVFDAVPAAPRADRRSRAGRCRAASSRCWRSAGR